MKRILVTGCAGFIGYHLVDRLVSLRKYKIIGVDNFVRGVRDDKFERLLNEANFSFFHGDLNSRDFVESLPSNIDYIIHLAAINGTQNFYDYPYDVAVSCVIPTWNLIERYRNTNLLRFFFAGTPESYATSIELGIAGIPTSENVPLSISSSLESRWSYSCGKTFSEVLLNGAFQQFGVPSLILRFHNVYGTRMGPHHFLPDFLTRVNSGDFKLYGGENTRAFLYVDDAVSDVISLLERPLGETKILNIGSSDEVSIQHVANEILNLLRIEANLEILPAPTKSALRRVPSLKEIDGILGIRRRTPLRKGLEECIREFRAL